MFLSKPQPQPDEQVKRETESGCEALNERPKVAVDRLCRGAEMLVSVTSDGLRGVRQVRGGVA